MFTLVEKPARWIVTRHPLYPGTAVLHVRVIEEHSRTPVLEFVASDSAAADRLGEEALEILARSRPVAPPLDEPAP